MSLVDYGSSEESSDEENAKEPECKAPSVENITKGAQLTEVDDNEKSIFSSLPKPKTQMAIDGKLDQLKNLLLKKDIKGDGADKKAPAKITVPSLSEFENDNMDKPKPKKIKPSANSAGLFAVLPPPKHTSVKEANRPLIPQVVKNQLNKTKVKFLNTTSNTKKGENTNASYISNKKDVEDEDEDEDDKETASTSYFGEGIATSNQYSVNDYGYECYNIPTNMANDVVPSNHLPDVTKTVNYSESFDGNVACNSDPDAEYSYLQPSNGPLELDDKALQILCGGKRKRNQMPVNIIDLSGEEIMPDSKEWLLKQLTEEKNNRNHGQRKSNGPSVQSRRKHQITYLAFQAKAQELELQNQWSNNRMSRRQTQSKYGF